MVTFIEYVTKSYLLIHIKHCDLKCKSLYFVIYYIRIAIKGVLLYEIYGANAKEVDDYISQFKAGYFSPLANLARMTEEVGELAREINHHFGEKKKDTEEDNTIKAELGDNLFVLLCIANSLNIDMTESFNDTMNKFNTRDKIALKENNLRKDGHK